MILIDFSSTSQFPLFFGTAIFSFEGISIVLPLENQMKTPRSMRGWNGVLNIAMTVVTCLLIAVGFFGYLKYTRFLPAAGGGRLLMEEEPLILNL